MYFCEEIAVLVVVPQDTGQLLNGPDTSFISKKKKKVAHLLSKLVLLFFLIN